MTTLERAREHCRAAGMKPDSPLQLALLTVVEAAAETRDAVSGARGLTPEAEDALVQRVGAVTPANGRLVARELRTRTVLGTAGAMIAALLVVGGIGYYQGRTDGAASVRFAGEDVQAAFQRGPGAAAAWLGLMRANDPVQALAACKALAGPRRACAVPMWLDPPVLTVPGGKP